MYRSKMWKDERGVHRQHSTATFPNSRMGVTSTTSCFIMFWFPVCLLFLGPWETKVYKLKWHQANTFNLFFWQILKSVLLFLWHIFILWLLSELCQIETEMYSLDGDKELREAEKCSSSLEVLCYLLPLVSEPAWASCSNNIKLSCYFSWIVIYFKMKAQFLNDTTFPTFPIRESFYSYNWSCCAGA